MGAFSKLTPVFVQKRLLLTKCHGFGGCRHVFYFEAYGFQLVDSASADWRRALQAS